MKKGIIKTILDDHRDAAMYRHVLTTICMKLSGKISGLTAHYEDETGYVRIIFTEIHKLRSRVEELELKLKQYE